MGDTIVGEEDVLYIDDCVNQLTPLQRSILDLLKRGYTVKEVADTLGTTPRNVTFTQRKLRILRGMDE